MSTPNTPAPAVDLPRLVSPFAMRPASTRQECFYCHQPIGGQHNPDCVLLKKKVKVRMIAEYEVEVPNHWDKHNVEFHRNEGSWCADNAIDELEALAKAHGCLCGVMRFEYIEDTSGEMIEEGMPVGWPPPCPHCGEKLLTSEDRGLHCDECDELSAKDIDSILERFNGPTHSSATSGASWSAAHGSHSVVCQLRKTK